MTKVQRTLQARAPMHRVGEGVLVDLHFEPVIGVPGANSNRMSANISSVPVPTKRYTADTCFLGYSHGIFELLFGQLKYGATELRNLVILKMSGIAAQQFLSTWDSVSDPTFLEAAKNLGLEAEELSEFSNEPAETVTMSVSIGLTAMSGVEACFDFYHASPFSIALAGATKKLALDPMVRVELRTSLMLGFIQALRSKLTQEGLEESHV